MDDGTRTRDFRHHKPALYQLSYAHHGPPHRAEHPAVYSGCGAPDQTAAPATASAAAFASSEDGPGRGAKTVRR